MLNMHKITKALYFGLENIYIFFLLQKTTRFDSEKKTYISDYRINLWIIKTTRVN